MKNLAIIPARGGSKRIPRKNIKPFLGKPIIAYSIETALASGIFDEVMVSTDDKEIEKIAKKFGAKVPFLRSHKNADDYASTFDVLIEVVDNYKENNKSFDTLCSINPCSPFVTIEKLWQAYELLKGKDLDCVFPVMAFSYPIQRALKLEGNVPHMFNPEFEKARSQDLIETYHDAGQFYFLKLTSLLSKRSAFTEKTEVIKVTQLEAQDIDNESDWKLGELKFQNMMQSALNDV